jgi:hypothetical protein
VAVIAVGYGPWLFNLLGQVAVGSSAWKTALTPDLVATETYYALTGSFAQTPAVARWVAGSVALGVPLVLLLLLWRGGWAGGFLFLAGLVPALLLLAQSMLASRGVYRVRYLTITQLTWLVALAYLARLIPYALERWVLAVSAVLLAGVLCHDHWGTIGPAASPGGRKAVEYILAKRSRGEPVVARTSFIYFGASYYARGEVSPKLCGPNRDRFTYRNSAHLRSEDLVTDEDLGRLETEGVWFITTPSYDAQAEYQFFQPENWKLVSVREFPQDDYAIEKPLTVEHYVIERPTDR